MSTTVKVSDAASLALHTMALLAARKERSMTARDIADDLKASKAHLSKVLRNLTRAGLLRAECGPGGGFTITRRGSKATLLKVYEVIEGPLSRETCLLHTRLCRGRRCILGGLLKRVNAQVRRYLSRTHVADLSTFPRMSRRG